MNPIQSGPFVTMPEPALEPTGTFRRLEALDRAVRVTLALRHDDESTEDIVTRAKAFDVFLAGTTPA